VEQRPRIDGPATRHAVGTSRTKIVATVGPASRDPGVLQELIAAGVSVFRLNFSHGTHEEHTAVLADIRTVSRKMGRHVAILQDLCGPKIRLEPFAGDVVDCALNDEFTLVSDPTSTVPRALSCTYRALPRDLKTGEMVLFADGTVAMTVIDAVPEGVRLRVTLAGRLRSRQGLNLPGSDLAVNALTEKDLHDLDWTARHAADVDFVALSFARGPNDVATLRHELQSRHCPAHVVVKIEKPQAVQQLDHVIEAADAVMVARGDLGVEMDVQRVPAIQKEIIAKCNAACRPVITATQMLNSMEHSSRPTRAEASDVFNAVLDGTDAVMLSAESAVGDYPVDAVATMRQICCEAEKHLPPAWQRTTPARSGLVDAITEAAVDAACLMTRQIDAGLIVVATDSGRTALALGNRRPSAIILALPRTESVARSLSLCWGVTAAVLREASWAEHALEFGVEWAKSQELVQSGDRAVMLRGQIAGRPDIRAVLAGTIA
jgi:pyruvate kinase